MNMSKLTAKYVLKKVLDNDLTLQYKEKIIKRYAAEQNKELIKALEPFVNDNFKSAWHSSYRPMLEKAEEVLKKTKVE